MTIHITTLANGLRIATDTMREAESVVLGAWVGVGTRHEPWNANGVAHLVEHMMFKGTKKRSAYALSAAIEKDGGMTNAHTTREETAYYARVLPENTEVACEVIADMLLHSKLSAKDLEREKQVIIQEIGRDLDSPEEYIFDLLHLTALPKQKIGRPILGSTKVIAKLPRSAVREYVRRYYRAANMVLVAAGKIEHEYFVKMIRKHFGQIPRGRAPAKEKTRVASGVKLVPKAIEQLHLILAFGGPGFHNHDIYATQLLSILLGGSASSRLFQKIREKRGLVYTISSSHMALSDGGIFQIYAGTDPERARELIPIVCEELRDVTRHITQGELDRAKAQCRADMLMGQENVMRRAEVLGHQILAHGRPISAEEIIKKLMAVTKRDVEAIARKLLSHRPILTALGPLEHLEDYKKIVRRLGG